MFTLGCDEKSSGRFRKDASERAHRFNIGRNERLPEGEEGNGRWRIEPGIVNQTDGGDTVSVTADPPQRLNVAFEPEGETAKIIARDYKSPFGGSEVIPEVSCRKATKA